MSQSPVFNAVSLQCPSCNAIFFEGEEVTCVLPTESLKKYLRMGRLTQEMYTNWLYYNVSLSLVIDTPNEVR